MNGRRLIERLMSLRLFYRLSLYSSLFLRAVPRLLAELAVPIGELSGFLLCGSSSRGRFPIHPEREAIRSLHFFLPPLFCSSRFRARDVLGRKVERISSHTGLRMKVACRT